MVLGPESFPRRARLTDPSHYQQVFKTGRRGRHPLIGVVALANNLGYPRLGLAVSRKVSRKAVIRNRIKRVLRETFRREQRRLTAVDFVVVAYPEAALASHDELANALLQLSQKMCRVCAKS